MTKAVSAYKQQYLKADNFWYGIVVPDYQDAMAEPSNFRLAWHCAISLVHMADWVFHTHKTAVVHTHKTAFVLHFHDSKGNPHSVSDETAFAKALEQGYSDFGLVQDIANAAKHLKRREPKNSTKPKKPNADAMAVESPNWRGTSGGLILNVAGGRIEFITIAPSVRSMWESLNAQHGWW